MTDKITAYKGFNADLTCREFKFEIGASYEHEGKVEACASGFDACEHPLDVFRYYPPATSRFALVEMAANGHNTQPWIFQIEQGQMRILSDITRRTPVVDPDDHHLWASLGCVAVNLSLAAGYWGRGGMLALTADGPVVEMIQSAHAPDPLFDAILTRQTSRTPFDGTPVPTEVLSRIVAAAEGGGAEVLPITRRSRIDRLRDLVLAANDDQIADAAFVAELKRWIRFSPREAVRYGDGLYAACSGAPPLPQWLGPHMFDLLFTAEAEAQKYRVQMDTSAALIVIVAPRNDPTGWMRAGQSAQRLQLQATLDGVRTSFVNQPVEVPSRRADLQSLLGLGDKRPSLILRLGYGPQMPYALRRPVAQVLRHAPA